MPKVPSRQADPLVALIGCVVPSQFVPGVEYRVGPHVGRGAMAVAFYAMRMAPEGQCPVVLKVLRADFVRQYGQAATLTVQKEAVALGRLNERVPSTPFVVRLIDTGTLATTDAHGPIDIPWVAVEYVYGGPEGTTLTQRVSKAVQDTGQAFDPIRAARAIECLCSGLSAVHEVGVIHRDLKPGNVLCCGVDDDEIFKVADFGVARPQGLKGTFFRDFVGTPGYVAPEAFGSRGRECGAWTDVFGLAGVVFFLLTGKKFLQVDSTASLLVAMGSPERRSILESPMLSSELRRRGVSCRGIDRALAVATSLNPDDRPQSMEAFAASLLPWLQSDTSTPRSPSSRVDVSSGKKRWSEGPPWTWITRHRASEDRVVRRVAWDADGRCLALTNRGLAFWNGTAWQQVPQKELGPPDELLFVHRTAPSRWLVGFNNASIASFSVEGMLDTLDLSETIRHLDGFDGELGDLAVMVDRTESGGPLLRAMSAWRWVRAIPLEGVTGIASVARVGDAQWLIAGRGENDAGLVAVYSPLDFTVQTLPAPAVRAFVACAGREALGTGVACGADGAMLWWQNFNIEVETVEGGHDVSAVAVDPAGNGWAAGMGRIWHREVAEGWSAWTCVWEDETWQVPFVSLFADVGLVIAVTADGAILEGRMAVSDHDTEFMERD